MSSKEPWYGSEHGPEVIGRETMANAISALTAFWQGRVVADVIPQTCKLYVENRQRAPGTARRELGTLQAAINWQHKNGRLTRSVVVTLPEASAGRKRGSPAPRPRLCLERPAPRRRDSTCRCSFSWASTLADAKRRSFRCAGLKWTSRLG